MTEPLKLGLAGLGTVGGGVLRLLAEQGPALAQRAGRPIEVVAVSARDKNKTRDADISRFRFVADAVELARDPEIDVFVELIGGESGVAKDAVEAALRAGKHVVTANKALLAHHGASLAALAEKSGVALNFEAAVAGGIPVVKVIRESLQGNDITRVYRIPDTSTEELDFTPNGFTTFEAPTLETGCYTADADVTSCAPNVVDVGYDRAAIVGAIRKQISHGLYQAAHLYGDGKAGERIADLLARAPLRVQKRIQY